MSRLLDQPMSRLVAYELSAHLHAWIFLLVASQAFGQDFLASGFIVPPIHPKDREHRNVTPGVQGKQVHPTT